MNDLLEPLRGALIGHGLLLPLLVFVTLGAAVFVTTSRLAHHGDTIADATGLGRFWIGTLLVGVTTSLPEIAATIAAVRMGALDMAVGNIFGSNAFNMAILLPMDPAYTPGPVLATVSPAAALAAQFAVVALALGIVGIQARSGGRHGLLRLESLLILAIYVGAMVVLARSG